jgi:hypothetical protein
MGISQLTNVVDIDDDMWFELFKPIKNPFDWNGSWDGHMFETFGVELEFVIHTPTTQVWTYIGADNGTTYLVSGFHLVNRIGYFICEVGMADLVAILVTKDCAECGRLLPSCQMKENDLCEDCLNPEEGVKGNFRPL